MLTKPKQDSELAGLVYSLTPKQKDSARVWYKNPMWLGVIVLIAMLILNIIFY
jgi:solute:Na+ symporter, SSS family